MLSFASQKPVGSEFFLWIRSIQGAAAAPLMDGIERHAPQPVLGKLLSHIIENAERPAHRQRCERLEALVTILVSL